PALLLVHVGREQPEAVVLDAEGAAGLGHSALAQDQRLPALGQRPADDGPLLEGDAQSAHAGHLSPFGDRSIRSLTASRGSLPSTSPRYPSPVIGMPMPVCTARSCTADAVQTPSATMLMPPRMSSSFSPFASRSPTRRLRPCLLMQVVIKSPSPANPAKVEA